MNLVGTWHIQSMELWDEDYLNMDVQAYITIESNYNGSFQFGLVTGDLDGSISGKGNEATLHFSWEGSDENDPAFGRGWCKLKDNDSIEGEIAFHMGDKSGFQSVRA